MQEQDNFFRHKMNPRNLAQGALGVGTGVTRDLMTGSAANIFTWVSVGSESRLGLFYISLIKLGINNPDMYQPLNVFFSFTACE